ncbi:unnamed protein product [Dimorphilus gyrociliatus]|uniref:mitogen-activated protein kinase kinase n=1 Tax=Dimorphilus gyrociliatus TaxID=2664684 RepID=A0A7I8V8A5_9ANNE|nr:unnamed protein product [Dimorphilus gyrociliatus]
MNHQESQSDDFFKKIGTEAQVRIDGDDLLLSVKDLHIIERLGEGRYGFVDFVRDRQSNKTFAVKKMTSTSFAEGERRSMMEVYVAIKSLHCPYTVNFYGAMATDGELWMLMERMDISLDKLRQNITEMEGSYKIDERIIGNMSYQIISGLFFLRSEVGVAHRDVKPSNILINKGGQVKICDFGICGVVMSDSLTKSNAGSTPYLAPEKLVPSDDIISSSSKSDVWSLGITILEFTIGKYPYRKWKCDFDAIMEVLNNPSPTLPPDEYSNEFNDFINLTLKKNIEERPRYPDLLNKPFITENENVDISAFTQKFSKTNL